MARRETLRVKQEYCIRWPCGELSQNPPFVHFEEGSFWPNSQQDGRQAPAYFSPNYKYFDQFLQTVENKTTVLISVFKEFLPTSIWPLISVLCAKRYHDFPSELFCLTIPKNFVGEPFDVSEIFWYRKILCFRGLCQDFLSKFLGLTVPKNFVGEPFTVSLISGIEKFYASEGYVTIFDFLSKFFCLTVPKIFAGEPFCAVFQKFPVAKKFMEKRGGEYQDFP